MVLPKTQTTIRHGYTYERYGDVNGDIIQSLKQWSKIVVPKMVP